MERPTLCLVRGPYNVFLVHMSATVHDVCLLVFGRRGRTCKHEKRKGKKRGTDDERKIMKLINDLGPMGRPNPLLTENSKIRILELMI